MDIRQLQIFVAVLEAKSFSRAAKRVFLTQPTVSGHIRALEESLDLRLFDRSGKTVSPTAAGETLYPRALEILKLVDQVRDEMNVFKGGDSGFVRLGGSNIPGQYILPRLLGEFKEERPNVQVSLKIGDTASVIDMVLYREIDLGMVGGMIPNRHLSFDPCFDDELVLITHQDHELCKRDEVLPEELVNYPFIVREEGSGTRMAAERAFKEAGIGGFNGFKVIAEMGSTEAVKQAVKGGVGLAIVSRRSVEDDLAAGVISVSRVTGADLKRKFYLVWDRRRTPSPTVDALKAFLLDYGRG